MSAMLFFEVFRKLASTGETVMVELKNDMVITGRLDAVDQFLNLKLSDIRVGEVQHCPQTAAMSTVFIRGSVVRYVHLDPTKIELETLRDDCRQGLIKVAQ